MVSTFRGAIWITSDSIVRHLCIDGIKFNSDIVAIELLRYKSRCTAPEEGVKHYAAFGTSGEQTGLHQLRRICRIVTALEWDSVDDPHIPLIPKRRDHLIGNGPVRTGPVHRLLLVLAGDSLTEFVPAADPTLHPRHGGLSHRFSDCQMVKEILF